MYLITNIENYPFYIYNYTKQLHIKPFKNIFFKKKKNRHIITLITFIFKLCIIFKNNDNENENEM